jgi:glycolate oxidase FAD binding subunit
MTLKVRPDPEASAIVWVPFPSYKRLADVLDDLNTSGTRPIALELLNGPAARTVGRELSLTDDHAVLAIGYEDSAASVRWQLDRLEHELGRTDLAVAQAADAEPLWRSLTEFQALEIGPISFVANLRPSSVGSFIGQLDPERWSAQAHAGNGIVRAHALGDWSLEQAARQIAKHRGMATRDRGNLILSRCPTEWKDSLRVWGEPRADWSIGEWIKRALDPHLAMNPGRFVGNC